MSVRCHARTVVDVMRGGRLDLLPLGSATGKPTIRGCADAFVAVAPRPAPWQFSPVRRTAARTAIYISLIPLHRISDKRDSTMRL